MPSLAVGDNLVAGHIFIVVPIYTGYLVPVDILQWYLFNTRYLVTGDILQ